MPKKPAPAAAEESAAPAVDPQKQYLMDQFGNLMEQVGDGFGGPLQEELISRLEQTIAAVSYTHLTLPTILLV